jgi:hypothetical protein
MSASDSKDLGQWAKSVVSSYEIEPPSAYSAAPEKLLGAEDAIAEWNISSGKSSNLFTRIATYLEFRSPDKVFLFGRRGTGKTSLIRMLDYEISQGEVADYRTSWVCDTHQLLLDIAGQIRQTALFGLMLSECAEALRPIWRWIIGVSAMLAQLRDFEDRAGEPQSIHALRHLIAQLLPHYDEYEPRNSVHAEVQRRLAYALSSQEARTSVGLAHVQINEAFNSADFRKALRFLAEISQERPVLVMLDAGDVYAVRDHANGAATTALIATLSYFRDVLGTTGVHAKAAFPSEIEPDLQPYNKGKMQGKIVLIAWTFRDLVSLVAKRYLIALRKDPTHDELAQLDDYHRAKAFLYQYLPSAVTTRSGLSFDTMAYIIRHTQKTPRQVILLMNSVLTFAKRQGIGPEKLREDPSVVVRGVHARLDQLVADAIDMYRPLYGELEKLIQRMLAEEESHFRESRLHQLVKRVKDLRLGEEPLSRLDTSQILIAVGVLGIAQRAHRINNHQWILEVLFEYQIKQQLIATSDSYLFVHPMFYTWLRTRVDSKTFTVPVAFEPEEDPLSARAATPALPSTSQSSAQRLGITPPHGR